MAQAVVDPAEIRRFATNLKRFNAELQSQLSALHGQFTALGDTWRDQEYEKFREEFEQNLAHHERFLDISGEFILFLLRKAERIEDYLNQR